MSGPAQGGAGGISGRIVDGQTDAANLTTAAQSAATNNFRDAAIAHYKLAIRDAMLNQICIFSLDPSFRELAEELAEMLGIDILDAAALLHPVSKATYDAAAGAIRR